LAEKCLLAELNSVMLERIKDNFTESIQTKISAIDLLANPVEHAGMILVQTLLSDNKIFTCGNGGSASIAQYLSSLLINQYETERPSLPAIALTTNTSSLTAIANDYNFDDIFAKQLRALAHNNDVLIAISPTGNDRNVIKSIEAAVSRDMPIIALTGDDGGDIAGLLGENDVEIRVPSAKTARIHETHLLIVHSLCDLIDSTLFPQTDD
jgi:DnaA initiator-associating protein